MCLHLFHCTVQDIHPSTHYTQLLQVAVEWHAAAVVVDYNHSMAAAGSRCIKNMHKAVRAVMHTASFFVVQETRLHPQPSYNDGCLETTSQPAQLSCTVPHSLPDTLRESVAGCHPVVAHSHLCVGHLTCTAVFETLLLQIFAACFGQVGCVPERCCQLGDHAWTTHVRMKSTHAYVCVACVVAWGHWLQGRRLNSGLALRQLSSG